MSGFLNTAVRFVRRTTQPYHVQTRTIVGFNILLGMTFFGLLMARALLIAPSCPPMRVRALNNEIVTVQGVCSEGWWSGFLANVIDNLAAGLIVAMVTSLLILLISPKHQIEEDLAPLAPWNIHEALMAPLAETKNYWFRGRSGRFMRQSVMPALYEAGKREAQRRQFNILLPDPADDDIPEAYAHYRNSLDAEKRTWDTERVRVEVVATVLMATYYSNRSQFFSADIFLKSDFALFRMDMSDDALIMTREDPRWPAIICSARSKFYASYQEEFRIEAENGTKLMPARAMLPDNFDESHVNPALAALGLQLQLSVDSAKAVIDAIRKPVTPYP